MRAQFAILFFIFFLFSINLTAQKNYKGKQKTQQPEITILPENTNYIFNKSVNDTLKIKLDKKTNELFEKHDIAGITSTILIPNQGIWQINKGFISKQEDIRVDSTSVFYWASVSKLITSTLIHQLVLEGSLSFDDKLSKWFPDFKNSKKITIDQLLTHTNGIPNFHKDPNTKDDNKISTPLELLERSKSRKNLFKPGEHWSYTNTGYLLLALIIEKIESKTFNQVLKERISDPLKLKTLEAAEDIPPNLALAHKGNTVINENYYVPLGAGNIISNSKDMALYFSKLLTGELIPLKMVHNMMTNLYPMFNEGQYYGRGIMLYDFNKINQSNEKWLGHSGGIDDYKAIITYDIKTQIIITISINENVPAESVAYTLFQLINEK